MRSLVLGTTLASIVQVFYHALAAQLSVRYAHDSARRHALLGSLAAPPTFLLLPADSPVHDSVLFACICHGPGTDAIAETSTRHSSSLVPLLSPPAESSEPVRTCSVLMYAGVYDDGGPDFSSLVAALPPMPEHFMGRNLAVEKIVTVCGLHLPRSCIRRLLVSACPLCLPSPNRRTASLDASSLFGGCLARESLL